MKFWKMTVALLFAALAPLTVFAQGYDVAPDPDRHKSEEQLKRELEELADIQKQVLVPMRDGVGLSTDIYLPKDRRGRVPIIWWKTPYNYNPLRATHMRFALKALRRGYAFAIQNERGKYFSEGDWEILGFPKTDGVDALDWFAAQDWSTGKVGAIGCSSPAEWQLALAAQNHPALAAVVPMAPGAGIGKVGPYWEQGNWYRGGAEQMFYPPWLYGSLQTTLRPEIPKDLSREERARLADWYDLDPEEPDVDWDEAIRHLPLKDMLNAVDAPNATLDAFTSRPPGDPAWREGGLFFDDDNIDAPALWLFSWYDVSIAPNLALFNHARNNTEDKEAGQNQFVAVGPNLHCRFYRDSVGEVGDRTFENAALDYFELVFDFFDRYVKGERNGFERKTPPVQYYEMGADKWRSDRNWPPRGSREVTFYLDSGEAGANSIFGDGVLARAPLEDEAGGSDGYTYDPMNPTPSLGGGICCIGDAVDGGVFDQRPNEARNDVLVYTSAPLEEGLHIAGPIKLTLYVSSDAPDTDFMVKLVDVFPDGTAYNLDETAQRARWREGYDKPPVFMEEDGVYEITIQPMVTANYFAPGHRIRLEVSSSNFPRFARNLNTAEPIPEQSEPRVARNRVHHSAERPSRLTLTVSLR
ncbi:MAG: CocE/NonD family hydrolase [Parvularculaceae bacterium]